MKTYATNKTTIDRTYPQIEMANSAFHLKLNLSKHVFTIIRAVKRATYSHNLIPRQEYWSVLPFPSPADVPDPGIESLTPALLVDSSLTKPPGKPTLFIASVNKYL